MAVCLRTVVQALLNSHIPAQNYPHKLYLRMVMGR